MSNPGSNIRMGMRRTADLMGELPNGYRQKYERGESIKPPKPVEPSKKPLTENIKVQIRNKIRIVEGPFNRLYSVVAMADKNGYDTGDALVSLRNIEDELMQMGIALQNFDDDEY